MNKVFFYIITILLYYNISIYSQEFIVSERTSNEFNIDPFTEDVYIKDLWAGDIYVTNLKTGITELSRFSTLPAFANKSHLAAFVDNRKLYFYDFEKDSTYLFLDSTGWTANIDFSPNDAGVIVNNTYYDLLDSSTYPTVFFPEGINYIWRNVWSSDSSIIRNNYKGTIFNLFIKEGIIDTLINIKKELHVYASLDDYDYNISINTLSYSIWKEGYAELRFYNLKNKQDTIIFSQTEGLAGTPCQWSPFAFTALRWSPNNNKLAFFSQALTVSGSGVLNFDSDSAETNLLSDCDEFGLKYFTQWLDNDTIIYVDETIDRILGFDVTSKIVAVEEVEELPESFSVRNYPNPFNNSTLIRFSFPVNGNAKVKIYDALGALVKEIHLENVLKGNYEIEWSGKNVNGTYLSSGIYFAQAELTSSNNKKYFQQLKMVLIK